MPLLMERRRTDRPESILAATLTDRRLAAPPGSGPTRCPGLPGRLLLRKEVIQPHLPIRLPCYDFTPVTSPTVVGCPLAVGSPVSGVAGSHGVTGGVYKARERIHRGVLIRDY